VLYALWACPELIEALIADSHVRIAYHHRPVRDEKGRSCAAACSLRPTAAFAADGAGGFAEIWLSACEAGPMFPRCRGAKRPVGGAPCRINTQRIIVRAAPDGSVDAPAP